MMKIKILVVMMWLGMGAYAQINEVINMDGDGMGNDLEFPMAVAVDSQGHVYIGGQESNNVFRLSASSVCNTSNPLCQWTEIMDATGAGVPGQVLSNTHALAVDSLDNLYVVGRFSDNVWRINNPQNCSTSSTPCDINEIINSSGDGIHTFDGPFALSVDSNDHVYVAGTSSNNVFRIEASSTCGTNGTLCNINEIADGQGDGSNNLFQPGSLATDTLGNVYVSNFGDNVLKIETPNDCTTTSADCVVTEIMDDSGQANFSLGVGIVTDSQNHVYVSSFNATSGPKVFKIVAPDTCSTGGQNCGIIEIFSEDSPQQAIGLVVDAADNVFLAGGNGDNAFRIDLPEDCSTTTTPCHISTLIDATGDGMAGLSGVRNLAVSGKDVYVLGAFSDNAFRLNGVADLEDLIFADDFE